MTNRIPMSLQLNGRSLNVAIEARETLADLLRDHLGHTGTHIGCQQGHCGACTVLVDGNSVRACLMLAVQANG
ncbi:MAG: (2Fe-2S)-binding protein, partial [Betaproteobacteria bacterium]